MINLNNSEETKGIKALLILEIIGRPAEHLTKTLNDIIEQMDKEPRVSVQEKKIAEPKEIKDHKNFYSSFAEVEVEVEEILDLVILCFKYMPAHIEIVNPELIAITNNSWSDILSELMRRLHGYDEIARVLQNEKTILENKLREVLGNIEKGKSEKNIKKEQSVKKKKETKKK